MWIPFPWRRSIWMDLTRVVERIAWTPLLQQPLPLATYRSHTSTSSGCARLRRFTTAVTVRYRSDFYNVYVICARRMEMRQIRNMRTIRSYRTCTPRPAYFLVVNPRQFILLAVQGCAKDYEYSTRLGGWLGSVVRYTRTVRTRSRINTFIGSSGSSQADLDFPF